AILNRTLRDGSSSPASKARNRSAAERSRVSLKPSARAAASADKPAVFLAHDRISGFRVVVIVALGVGPRVTVSYLILQRLTAAGCARPFKWSCPNRPMITRTNSTGKERL